MELTDAARGRGIIERWCVLAEQRLDYLTELFETGRWQRFFGEVAFLENIREAKESVETWRGLLNREATADNRPVDLSWLGRRSALPARHVAFLDDDTPGPTPAPVLIDEPDEAGADHELELFDDLQPEAATAEPSLAPAEAAPWQQALDPDLLQQRYPLLRNAF